MHRSPLADFISERLNAPNLLAGAFFIAVGAAAGVLSIHNLDIGTALQMGPGYFPLILSAIMILLGIAISVSKSDAATGETSHPLPWRGLLLIGSAPIVFATLVTPLGLAPAIALTVATVTFASKKATPKLAFFITLGVTALCIAVFKFGLGIPAPLFNPKLGG